MYVAILLGALLSVALGAAGFLLGAICGGYLAVVTHALTKVLGAQVLVNFEATALGVGLLAGKLAALLTPDIEPEPRPSPRIADRAQP